MTPPKIANAINYIDADLVASADKAAIKAPVWKRFGALAAALLLVFSGVLLFSRSLGTEVNAVVALDVNPSIELEINQKERVVAVRANNADAVAVLDDMDLKDADINVAVNAIIGSMVTKGYLSMDRNSILLSVSSEDGERGEALKAAVLSDIQEQLAASRIEASVIAQSFTQDEQVQQRAQDNSISVAKATLLEKVMAAGLTDAHGVPYTYETLAGMSIHELKTLLEAKNTEVEGVESSGKANNNGFIGEEQALECVLSHAALLRDAISSLDIELDYDDRTMVYSVEFRVGNVEFEYEINATTGDIMEYEKESEDDPGEDDKPEDDKPPMDEPVPIGKEKALEIVREHLGVLWEVLDRIDIEFDYDEEAEAYCFEFRIGTIEYEYEIDAITGDIVKVEQESEDDRPWWDPRKWYDALTGKDKTEKDTETSPAA